MINIDNLDKTHIDKKALIEKLSISPSTLERLVAKGFPKADLKLGKRTLWKLEDVNFWLNASKRPAKVEQEQSSDPII